MKRDAVTITDHRTNLEYEIPVVEGAISAMELRKIKVDPEDFGLLTYDPGFKNTAACRSRITYIDGDEGILRYRGYPIEELAEKSTFLEVAYLLLDGELPDADGLAKWRREVADQAHLPADLRNVLGGFPRDGHPMGIVIGCLAALATHHPDARDVSSADGRRLQILRILGKMPLVSAYAFRHTKGQGPLDPDRSLSYTGRFLQMIFGEEGGAYRPHAVLERALDVLFILHADHEQNCSTNAMRSVASSEADPFSATAAATAALWGPLHGGANEAVLRMLDEIGSREKIGAFIDRVKKGETRLMGFGHRVYKNYDPRAKIIKKLSEEVFAVQGVNPLLEIALELEQIALSDDYFVSRKLYPNVDFYSGLIYQSMGFPTRFFPVLFATARAAGWLAQWNELVEDPDQKIARPRQLYLGAVRRAYPDGRAEPDGC